MVEVQHEVSTRRLVDTLDEQAILEDIVEEVKPVPPSSPRFAGLHFLLSTPFRYPPLPHGSRFGSATERSLWYGAIDVETSLAEKAYHRLLFVKGTAAVMTDMSCRWSAYRAAIRTTTWVDLAGHDFATYHRKSARPSRTRTASRLDPPCDVLEVEVFGFPSARCPKKGNGIGMFEPAFSNPRPLGVPTTWECWMTSDGCETIQRYRRKILTFKTRDFEVDGKLPSPGVTLP